MSQTPSTTVCILGTPRSGTSLTARLLNLAGVYLGESDALAPAGPGNTAGFWELRRMGQINAKLLIAMGGNNVVPPPYVPDGWEHTLPLDDVREEARDLIHDTFDSHEVWGWKDPRNSFTLPFWQQLIPRMRYVICVRNPVDMVASSAIFFEAVRRGPQDRAAAFDIWAHHIASAIVNTSGRPRRFVAYEEYFGDWRGTVDGLIAFAGLDRPAGRRESEVEQLLKHDLCHHHTPSDDVLDDADLTEAAHTLYGALRDGLDGDRLDGLARELLADRLANQRQRIG